MRGKRHEDNLDGDHVWREVVNHSDESLTERGQRASIGKRGDGGLALLNRTKQVDGLGQRVHQAGN